MKPFFRCPVCNAEYENESDAEKCSMKQPRKHKYKKGTLVRVKLKPEHSSFVAIIEYENGWVGHEPQYSIDSRNGICSYNVTEKQIVGEIMSKEEYDAEEGKLDAFMNACESFVKDVFGDNVEIDDYSHLEWDSENIAKINFYIKRNENDK